MSTFKVIVKGDRLLIRKFDKARRLLKDELFKAGERSLKQLLEATPEYPIEPLGSTYVRTFNLEAAITSTKDTHPMSLSEVKRISDGVEIVFGVSGYGPLVIGPGVQAWMHEGRWWTLLDVLRRAKGDILDEFHRGKKRAFRRAGIGITGR